MSKVLIVITDETYVRNYLRTSAFSALEKEHDCHIVCYRGLALADEVARHEGFHGYYDLDPVMEKRHHFLFNLMMWRYRKKSATFFYRWLRNSNWHLVKRNGHPMSRILSYIHWFGSALINPKGIRIPLLASRVLFPVTSFFLKRSIRYNTSIFKLIDRHEFDLIIYPSAAFDSVSVDLVSIGRDLQIQTLCLIDNWDNLSSKTVFWKKPDHLGVWGPQASEQAQKIHGFSFDQLHLLGTPRFEGYFAARIEMPKRAPYDFPYGLFVGSAMPFDDIGTLRTLEEIMARSPSLSSDFRLVYRPHPWKQKRRVDSDFRQQEFGRIVLDRQFSEMEAGRAITPSNDPSFQPALDYYPGLLLNSTFVVGPLTTMLFEGSLCGKPVIALSYFDGHHANTSKRYFTHFDGMEKVPGFNFCQTELDLFRLVTDAINYDTPDYDEVDRATSYFLYRGEETYASRLNKVVSYVLANPPRSGA
jgi:hypothetical protein